MIGPQHDAPCVFSRKLDVIVFFQLRRLDEDGEVQQAFVQPLRNDVGVSADEMKVKQRVGAAEILHLFRQIGDPPRFGAADTHVAALQIVHLAELLCRLIYHIDNIRGAFPEEHALFGQRHAAGAADEQLLPQFLLQMFHLDRQGWLGNMQAFRRAGHISLPCNLQEVSKNVDFHSTSFLLIILIILDK